MQDLRSISPDVYREQRYNEGKFNCDICGMPWPMSHQLKMTGGLRVGRECCYEPDGDEVDRDLRRAYAARQAARITMTRAHPPVAPDGVPYNGPLDLVDEGWITTITPNPIVLSRGGAAVAVTLDGVSVVASDTIAYGDAGITDAAPPSLVDNTWTLSVQASVGVAVGKYTFTYNGTVWQAVFDVR